MSIFVNPFPQFLNPASGFPIDNGSIYIGMPGTDPVMVANRIPVTVMNTPGFNGDPIPQPIRTSNAGVPIYQGVPVEINIPPVQNSNTYSLALTDKDGNVIFRSESINISDATTGLSPIVQNMEQVGVPSFDSSVMYRIGSRILHNGINYESRVDNPTAAPTGMANDPNWMDVSYANFIKNIPKGQLGEIQEFAINTIPSEWHALDGTSISSVGRTDLVNELNARGNQFAIPDSKTNMITFKKVNEFLNPAHSAGTTILPGAGAIVAAGWLNHIHTFMPAIPQGQQMNYDTASGLGKGYYMNGTNTSNGVVATNPTVTVGAPMTVPTMNMPSVASTTGPLAPKHYFCVLAMYIGAATP